MRCRRNEVALEDDQFVVDRFHEGHIWGKVRKKPFTMYAVYVGEWNHPNHGVMPDVRWVEVRDDRPDEPVVEMRFMFIWEPDHQRIAGITEHQWYNEKDPRALVRAEGKLQKKFWIGREYCFWYAVNRDRDMVGRIWKEWKERARREGQAINRDALNAYFCIALGLSMRR